MRESPSAPAALATPQACRAVACLLVALLHGASLVEHRTGVMPLFGVTEFGYAGVHLFFVISGFILCWVHRDELGDLRKAPRYLGKRLVRIYPFYWIVLLALGAGKLFGSHASLGRFVTNALTFSPDGKALIVAVAWTLAYEIVFYAIFASFFASRALGLAVFAAWFAAIAANALLGFSDWYPLGVLNALFLAGMLAAVAQVALRERVGAARRDRIGVASLAAGALVFAVAAAFCLALPDRTRIWSDAGLVAGFGIGSALLLLASASDAVEAFLARRRWLLLIGDASYAIYLTHFSFEKRTANALRSLGWIPDGEPSQAAAILLLAILLGVAIAGGLALHLLVEKPVLRSARRALGLAGRAPAAAAALP